MVPNEIGQKLHHRSTLGEALTQEELDIRGAYPLMDAVARSEGWEDPDMDSYDVYARKPKP